MDWSDPAVMSGSRDLDSALKEFCEPTLDKIWSRALELLDTLRACRVTLDFLRQVNSADVVSEQKPPADRTSSVTTPLDDRATKRVKGYLRRKVDKLKTASTEEYHRLVPQERDAFERGFDNFVEKCIEDSSRIKNQWIEEHVSSGAAQPQLWKIYVAFQRQLRDACSAQSRKPLPPPLFMTEHQAESSEPRETLPDIQGLSNLPSNPRIPISRGHNRMHSFAEFGRYPYAMFPQSPFGIPYVQIMHPYPVPQGRMSNYYAPNDIRRDFTEQWITRKSTQDDTGMLYSNYDGTMYPGFQATDQRICRRPHPTRRSRNPDRGS